MFTGRYGNDQLNRVLMFTSLGLIIINLFIPYMSYWRNICTILYVALLAITLLRMFSRDIPARQHENAVYMRLTSRLSNLFRGASRTRAARNSPTFEERRRFKYFYCNQCTQRLRVPRGKGKLRVTCTRCGNKFDIKS